jgi:hypothetical protein
MPADPPTTPPTVFQPTRGNKTTIASYAAARWASTPTSTGSRATISYYPTVRPQLRSARGEVGRSQHHGRRPSSTGCSAALYAAGLVPPCRPYEEASPSAARRRAGTAEYTSLTRDRALATLPRHRQRWLDAMSSIPPSTA